jgi:hypothetical protein
MFYDVLWLVGDVVVEMRLLALLDKEKKKEGGE